MGKWGGVSKTMYFRIKLFFLPFVIINKVILKRSLDFIIIPISVPGLSWKYLRGVIWSSEVASVFSILGKFRTLLTFEYHLFHLCRQGGMTGCPSKPVTIGFEFPLGESLKSHHPLPSYLPLSILLSCSSIPLHWSGHWVGQSFKGCTLPCGKKGLKAQKGKAARKR
jgi:hypothetical protein